MVDGIWEFFDILHYFTLKKAICLFLLGFADVNIVLTNKNNVSVVFSVNSMGFTLRTLVFEIVAPQMAHSDVKDISIALQGPRCLYPWTRSLYHQLRKRK